MASSSGAWAASMHEVEEGTLGWANTMQWSLNRLIASQIAMTNITTVPQGKRQCKYYNEGSCSHDNGMVIIHTHAPIVASRDANLHIQKPNARLKPEVLIRQA